MGSKILALLEEGGLSKVEKFFESLDLGGHE